MLLGSRSLSYKGVIGIYKIISIKKKECDEDEKELLPFSDQGKNKRKCLQYRIKIKPYRLYDDNLSIIKKSNSLSKLINRVGLGTIDKELYKKLKDKLKDY